MYFIDKLEYKSDWIMGCFLMFLKISPPNKYASNVKKEINVDGMGTPNYMGGGLCWWNVYLDSNFNAAINILNKGLQIAGHVTVKNPNYMTVFFCLQISVVILGGGGSKD